MIVAFYHLLETNNWYDLAAEQFAALAKARFPGKIYAHLAGGSDFGAFELRSMGGALGLDITVSQERGNQFEFPTLHALWRFCAETPGEHQVLYFHGKNVTLQAVHGSKWRWAMMGSVIIPWRDRLEDLRRYDACGFCLMRWYGQWIFAGNFWWATSAWIRDLPEPKSSANRFDGETWLLSRPGWKAKSLIATGEHGHDEPCLNGFYGRHGNPHTEFLRFMADADLPPDSPPG